MLWVPAATVDVPVGGDPGVELGHELLERALLLHRVGDLLLGPGLVAGGFRVLEFG
ncbi:MAG: hypothetical protein ACRENX_12015 [Candidatus Dormibacteria bacterium]